MLNFFYYLINKVTKLNCKKEHIFLLIWQIFISLTASATETIANQDYTVDQDDNTGLKIHGSPENINISNNVNLTNTAGEETADVITSSQFVATNINIGENANVSANGEQNAINMGNSIQSGTITINNKGNITAEQGIDIDLTSILEQGSIAKNQAITFKGATPNLELYNEGTIIGGIIGSNNNDIINNFGIIKGNIYGSEGNDTINFNGGKIDGKIDGGSGNNTLNINNDFATFDTISVMNNINVSKGDCIINHNITGIDTNLINHANTYLNSSGAIFGAGNIENRGKFVINANLSMHEVNNVGTMIINNSDNINVHKLLNNENAVLEINNTNKKISVAETNNQIGATLNIDNTYDADFDLGTFNKNYGNFNLTGTVQLKNNLINEDTGIISFQAPGAKLNGLEGITNNGKVIVYAPTTLNGNYIMNPRATHVMHIDRDGNPGTLTLEGGSADFAAQDINLQVVTSMDYLFTEGQVIKLATGTEAAKELSMTNFNIANPSVVLKYSAVNEGNDVLLKVNKNSYEDLITEPTPNTNTIAKVLGELVAQPDIISENLKLNLARLEQADTSENFTNHIDQFVPDLGVIQGSDANIQSASTVFNQINDRIQQIARSNSSNLFSKIESGYAAGEAMLNRNVWLKGFGISSKQKRLIETNGYNANMIGAAFGVDREIRSNMLLGTSLSYSDTKMKSKDELPDQNKIKSYQITLYHNYSNNKYYLNSYVAAGFNKYKTQRTDAGNNQYNASFNGIQPALKFDLGMPKVLPQLINKVTITPNSSLQYNYLRQNRYDEEGTGNPLKNVNSKNTHLLRGGIGVRCEVLQLGKFKNLTSELRAMGLYDVINTKPQINTQFQEGSGSFILKSDKIHRFTFNFGASLNYVNSKGITFAVNYDLFGKKKFIAHSGTILAKYSI